MILQNMIKNHFLIFFKLFDENTLVKSARVLPFKKKINESNRKVFTDCRVIGLHSEISCYDIFIINIFFDIFWSAFNAKAIKLCHAILIHQELLRKLHPSYIWYFIS